MNTVDPTRFTHIPSPAVSRTMRVIGERVVQFETRHLDDSIWVATAWVSQPLPARIDPCPPQKLVVTGPTEEAVIRTLEHQVEAMRCGCP
jgi:hypothetical protein